jgi:pimeloyl-ACP methyl ester carboxylesterase
MEQPHLTTVIPDSGTRRHPLLFVHGAWHGAWVWGHFQGWFSNQGWETHAVDLRGHGHTPNDRSLRRTRIKHYVEDLAAAIDSLDRPPIVIAHSMGGLVAQRCLEQVTVPGAVLVAPVPLGGATRATVRTLRRHPWKFLKANLTLSLGPLVEKAEVAADLFLPGDATPEQIEWLHGRLQTESYPAYLDMLFFVRARPQLVQTPIEIVAAAHDRIFGLKELARTAGAYGVDLRVINNAAHDVMLGPRWEEAAAVVATAIESF